MSDTNRSPASLVGARAGAVAVGIDWGTTNRRAYLLGSGGTCLAEHQDGDGMLAARGRFADSLQTMLQALGVAGQRLPVLMSGMVGSASGWVEAPYLALQTPLRELREHLVRVPGAPCEFECAIVPGYCQRAPAATDVMRGEETQLLGALALGGGDGWYLLPGTHSKWARLQDGAIAGFTTFMTGELFALLSQHGTLAAAGGSVGERVPEAFLQGLRQAAVETCLSSALFGCRARVVSQEMPASHAASTLSGLLIGAEFEGVRQRNGGALPDRVTLIGSAALATHYRTAANELGMHVDLLDPREAYLAALVALRRVD